MGKTRGDLERAVVVLKRVVEKLQAENKKLHAARLNDVHEKVGKPVNSCTFHKYSYLINAKDGIIVYLI